MSDSDSSQLARDDNGMEFLKEFQGSRSPEMKSQKGQDYWVEQILGKDFRGYFVDLAAADGITHSNTWYLEQVLGWQGLLIEPNPEFFAELRDGRSSTCVQAVVSDQEELVSFRQDNGQLGGIVADDTDNNMKIRRQELEQATVTQLQAVTLDQILSQNAAPQWIDYFSLDVEGAEERVIRSLDFSKYEFGLITIERPNSQVNSILFDNGYRFIRNCSFDSFYAHQTTVDRYSIVQEPFSQVPPKDW